MSACWMNGSCVAAEDAVVSVYDHGLLYGDGVFEGIRFYRQQPFYVQAHLQRLFDSANALDLHIPYTQQQLRQAIDEVIRASALEEGYLRLVATRGRGPLGLDPALCKTATVFVLADELRLVNEQTRTEGIRLMIASTRRLPSDGLDPRIKSLNYLNHALARMEATRANAHEAVLLNHQGKVTEGSTDNIFIVKNQLILTPPVSDGALDGITRGLVIELARQLNLSCQERSLTAYDLYTADECFITGTAVELLAVREVDGRRIPACPGKIYQRLLEAFARHIDEQTRQIIREVY